MTLGKIKGLKATCSMTKDLGKYWGENVQVFYDIREHTVFGVYHTLNRWTVINDDTVIYVNTYYRQTTQKDIREDIERAVSEYRKIKNLKKSAQLISKTEYILYTFE